MSFEDDMYADIVMDKTMNENCVDRHVKETDDKQVIKDIEAVIYDKEFDSDSFAEKNREILKTVKRIGRVSIKQKWCFCRFLVGEGYYEPTYDKDHPMAVG